MGGGAAQQFPARSCFYNSLSIDLCPLTGLSWEFLRSEKLLGSQELNLRVLFHGSGGR